MEVLKFFILDSTCGKAIENIIRDTATELGYKVRIDLSTNFEVTRLPRDYDGYLIHLSNTSEEAIMELREEQPWSKIFGLSGESIWQALSILQKDLDGLYRIIDSEEARTMLIKTREIYSVSDK